jgi:hypothetical protein
VAVAAAIGGMHPNRGDGEGAGGEGERRIKQKISYPWTVPGGSGGGPHRERRLVLEHDGPKGCRGGRSWLLRIQQAMGMEIKGGTSSS